jgi:hypothetical protein
MEKYAGGKHGKGNRSKPGSGGKSPMPKAGGGNRFK